MLWGHPFIQILTLSAALYVLYLGWLRWAGSNGSKKIFPWKTHVRLGRWVMLFWIAGGMGGLITAYTQWGTLFITGTHAYVGLAIIFLSFVGYISGYMLTQQKSSNPVLAKTHGLLNAMLVAMALWQAGSGIMFITMFLLP